MSAALRDQSIHPSSGRRPPKYEPRARSLRNRVAVPSSSCACTAMRRAASTPTSRKLGALQADGARETVGGAFQLVLEIATCARLGCEALHVQHAARSRAAAGAPAYATRGKASMTNGQELLVHWGWLPLAASVVLAVFGIWAVAQV